MMAVSPVVSIWSYEGRSSRSDYLLLLLITSILGSISGTIMVKVGGGFRFFSGIFFIAVMWVSMCACSRRMHDVGRSGWWSLVALVPGANFIFGLYALFAPGQDRDKDYDLSPSLPTQATATPQPLEARAQIPQPTLAPLAVNAELITQIPGTPVAAEAEPMEEFWAQALHECESAAMKAGLWAKAFADAGGEEKVAKATYIRLRAMQLQAQYSENQDSLQRARNHALWVEQEKLKEQLAEDETMLAKMTEAELVAALLPKGKCPSCDAVISLTAEHCPICTALFTLDSKWKVKPLSRSESIAQKTVDDAVVYALRTKEDKADENARSLIFLGILLLIIVLAAVKS